MKRTDGRVVVGLDLMSGGELSILPPALKKDRSPEERRCAERQRRNLLMS